MRLMKEEAVYQMVEEKALVGIYWKESAQASQLYI